MKGYEYAKHSAQKGSSCKSAKECEDMKFLRSIFRYRESKIVYRLGCWILRILPIPKWVTIKTPYGVIIHPKDFRLFSMALDLVEPEIQNTFEKWIREADVFIDVGAAVGYYVLKAHKLNPQAIKIAIEPDFIAFNVLKANLAINGILDNQVKVLNIACSDKEEETEINTCVPPYQTKKVPAKPLVEILENLKIELSRKSVLLIDVEGAGVKVIQGSINFLSMSRPKVIMELHEGKERGVQKILKSLGYNINKPSKHFIIAS